MLIIQIAQSQTAELLMFTTEVYFPSGHNYVENDNYHHLMEEIFTGKIFFPSQFRNSSNVLSVKSMD